VSGYYGDLSALIKGFLHKHINECEATTLGELRDEICRIEAKIDEAIPILQKAFTDRRRKEHK
jgi:hypothetical protein